MEKKEKKDLGVLIIEDEYLVADFLSAVLRRSGFNPDWAASEEEGLELVSQKKFDIIVSDTYCANIPYGPRIVSRAKEISKVRVVATSGAANGIEEWKGLEIDYFIRKPVSPKALMVIMDSLYESLK